MSKKILFTLILGCIFSIGFTSCNDDDDDHVDGSKFIGNWTHTGKKEVMVNMSGASTEKQRLIENYIKNSYQPFLYEGDIYRVEESESFSITRGESLWMGDLTYAYSKSNGSFKIYMSSGKEPYITYHVVSVTDSSAILEYTYDMSEIHWKDIDVTNIKITSATALIHLQRTKH